MLMFRNNLDLDDNAQVSHSSGYAWFSRAYYTLNHLTNNEDSFKESIFEQRFQARRNVALFFN